MTTDTSTELFGPECFLFWMLSGIVECKKKNGIPGFFIDQQVLSGYEYFMDTFHFRASKGNISFFKQAKDLVSSFDEAGDFLFSPLFSQIVNNAVKGFVCAGGPDYFFSHCSCFCITS